MLSNYTLLFVLDYKLCSVPGIGGGVLMELYPIILKYRFNLDDGTRSQRGANSKGPLQ